MSLRGGPRCAKHPSHLLVGVCSFCLRERLSGLADAECASDSASDSQWKKKKKSPSPRASLLATTQGFYHTSRQRASDQPTIATSRGVNATPFSRLHDNKNSVNPQPALNPFSPSKAVDQAKTIRCAHQPSSNAVSHELPAMATEAQSNGRKLSSVKRPSSAESESIKLPIAEVKMPILEGRNSYPAETKSIKLTQKDACTDCTSPCFATIERGRLEKKLPTSGLSDSERSSSGAVATRRSLPCKEPRTESSSIRRDTELTLSDASPNSRQKKKTLSSLFSLDDAEFPAAKAKPDDSMTVVQAKGDSFTNASSSAPIQNSLQTKVIERRCRHGSFSERVEPKPYLFPVPESGNNRPLSWFSSFFRKRKKKPNPKPGENMASFSEHNNGWEDGRRSWEAPRPSSWEQYGFSSFEGPRSSWEPARPSWEGVMRTTDSESLLNGFDFVTESSSQVREDVRHEGNILLEECGRRSIDVKRMGPRSKPFALKFPHFDDKDRGKTLPSAKPVLMHRDVSTQTTPPRALDATEMYIQQRLQHDHYGGRNYAKGGSQAVWSKVWTKTWSNSKWVFKQKDRRHKPVVSAAAASEGGHGQGNIVSGRPSFPDGNNADTRQPAVVNFDNIMELEAWDTFYSPLHNGGGSKAAIRLASKVDAYAQKDQHPDEGRTSDAALENGLLKFYLTPVRGHGMKGRSKQEVHAL